MRMPVVRRHVVDDILRSKRQLTMGPWSMRTTYDVRMMMTFLEISGDMERHLPIMSAGRPPVCSRATRRWYSYNARDAKYVSCNRVVNYLFSLSFLFRYQINFTFSICLFMTFPNTSVIHTPLLMCQNMSYSRTTCARLKTCVVMTYVLNNTPTSRTPILSQLIQHHHTFIAVARHSG